MSRGGWFKAVTNRERTGIVVALYPYNTEWGIELQRAPDDGSGDPDTANAQTIAIASPGVTSYLDQLPLDGANRHYRSRHVNETATESGWTNWVAATPVIVPDPLPPVPTLVPTIDVVATVSAGSVSFAVTSSLGELQYGVIEFQDPETTGGTADATATDKTINDIKVVSAVTEWTNRYISVAGAGAAAALFESRVDSVTSGVALEAEDAAGTTVNDNALIIGGGWFDDFDYDGTAESSETNTRNRPTFGSQPTWIMFRAKANNEVSSPTLVDIQPTIQPALIDFDLFVTDDSAPGSGDDQYNFSWTPSAGVTDAGFDLDLEGGKEDDRSTVLASGTEASPATNTSKQVDDAGAADGSATPKHWGRGILKDSGGATVAIYEVFNVIPAI